ncbi:right-handed parallel beta-helix repeat-containing protein [bacterium]|nr:right-handed parallel beta-helix repeat-containing protein [bacterium]
MISFLIAVSLALPFPPVISSYAAPSADVIPGQIYRVEAPGESALGAPVIYSYTPTAMSDESFVIVGENLGDSLFVWGPSAHSPYGQSWQVKIQFSSPNLCIATLPQDALDGLYIVWPGRNGVWGKPIRLNAPQPYWCTPDVAHPGDSVRVFGQCLAHLPDERVAYVYITKSGKRGIWAEVEEADRYAVRFRVPEQLNPGEYEVWVHAGYGGNLGWGGPVKLRVVKKQRPLPEREFRGGDLQSFIERVASEGGGIVKIPEGKYELKAMLKVPEGIFLKGEGLDKTELIVSSDPSHLQAFSIPVEGRWGQAVGGIHNKGDSLEYEITVPEAGEWTIWLRYAADNAPFQLEDMGGRTTLTANDEKPLVLLNLPNTGDWGKFVWSKVGKIILKKGRNHLRWVNQEGGGLNIDAFLFAKDPSWKPPEAGFPKESENIVILQAENVISASGREIHIPSEGRAGIWLMGDNCGVSDLTLRGSMLVNIGIAVRHPDPLKWLDSLKIESVRVFDIAGKEGENCPIFIRQAKHIKVIDCDLTGGCPLYISGGASQGEFIGNKLRGVSRIGPNATGAIQGRTEPFSQCVIEKNTLICPPAGGPTSARLIWISTGRGSVDDNYIAYNRAENPRFGDIAGTDQNVGEMILLESCMRYAYYGNPEEVDELSVTLPANAPFLPPNQDTGEFEPPASEYYVVVLSGQGMGQVRRVIGRKDKTLMIDRYWDIVPLKDSKILITTLFARNIIVGNETINGMSGLQLWIGGWENIFARNKIKNQRRQGIFLFSATSSLDPQMPASWNRGIGVLLFNTVEYNWIENTSDGILLYSDNGNMPVEWPRALGTVIRHNTVVNSRFNAINITGTLSEDKNPSILGTVIEFNFCRDQRTGIALNPGVRGALIRRNLFYFWNPILLDGNSVGMYLGGKDVVVENTNNIEGPIGEENPQGVIREKRQVD